MSSGRNSSAIEIAKLVLRVKCVFIIRFANYLYIVSAYCGPEVGMCREPFQRKQF